MKVHGRAGAVTSPLYSDREGRTVEMRRSTSWQVYAVVPVAQERSRLWYRMPWLGTCVARRGSHGRRNGAPQNVEYSANHVILNYLCCRLQVQERQMLVQEQTSPNKSTPISELWITNCKVALGWHMCQPPAHGASYPTDVTTRVEEVGLSNA